jgi:hypothetical protein
MVLDSLQHPGHAFVVFAGLGALQFQEIIECMVHRVACCSGKFRFIQIWSTVNAIEWR